MTQPWEQDWSGKRPAADASTAAPWERNWGTPSAPATPASTDGQMVSGFKRSFQELPGLAAGVGAYAADVLGANDTRDALIGYAQRKNDEVAAAHANDAQSITDAWDGKVGWLDFLANASGYVAGQALQSIATGGFGALGAKMVAKAGAKELAEAAAAKAIAAGAGEQLAQKAATDALVGSMNKAMQRGGIAGAMGHNFGMELGSIYPDAVDEAKGADNLSAGDKFRVIAAASLAAGVDTAGEAIMASRVFKGSGAQAGSMLGRAAKEVPAGMLREGGTEAVQTVLEHYGAGQPIADEKGMRDIIDSAGVGAVGGALGGGLASRRAHAPAATAADVLAAPTVDDAINKATLAIAGPVLKPAWEVVDGALALPGPAQQQQPGMLRALPNLSGQTVYMADERGNIAPQPAELRTEALNRQFDAELHADALAKKQAELGLTPGLQRAQQQRMVRDAESNLIPVGNATELPYIPTGEATDLERVPAGEASDAIPTGDASPLEAIPAGDASETIPTPEAHEVLPVGEAADYIPTGDASEVPRKIATGKATEVPVETIQADDLLTGDGMPYGSRTAANLRAKREGLPLAHVVEIPGAGWVIRPNLTARSTIPAAPVPAQPNGTRGTNAGDVVKQPVNQGTNAQPTAATPRTEAPAQTAGQAAAPATAAGPAGVEADGLKSGATGVQPFQRSGMSIVVGGNRYPISSFKEASDLSFRAGKEAERRAGVAQKRGMPTITDAAGNVIAHVGVGNMIINGPPVLDGDPLRAKVLYDPVDEIRAQMGQREDGRTVDAPPTALKLPAPVNAGAPVQAPSGSAAAAPVAPAPKPRVYKTRLAANVAKKASGNTQRVKAVNGGFILRDATEKELAAADAASRRQSARMRSGGAPTLLAEVARLGGLDRESARKDLGVHSDYFSHPSGVFGAPVFRKQGGKSAEHMLEALKESNYLPQGADLRALEDAVGTELHGTPVHALDHDYGADEEARAQGALDQQLDVDHDVFADLTVDELHADGYTGASPEVQQATEEALADAEALGLDREALIEDAARMSADDTEDKYHATVQRLAREAIAAARPDAQGPDARAARGSGEDHGQAAEAQGGSQDEELTPAERRKLEAEYQTRATEVLQELQRRGDLPKLFKTYAGVRTLDNFQGLPIDEQADAYASYVEAGGKPVKFAESYNDKVTRLEREAVIRRLQADREVRQANGRPFKTEASARQFQQENDLAGTHEPTAADGGFVLRQLPPALQEELRRKAAGLPTYAEAAAAVDAEMGLGETAEGDIDATDEQFAERDRRITARMRGEAPLLTAQTADDLKAKADREDAAEKAERAQKAADQERLRKDAEARDNKARADQTIDDFQLGQSAEQQMSGMGDLFGDPAQPKAKPAPLYASRPVTNAADIMAWAASQGFKSTLPADDLHVTVAYSRDAVDSAKVPPLADSMTVNGGKRTVEPLGDKGAVVLKFTSPDMQSRWKQYRDAGASWDYESYTPHVTITYDGKGVDLSKVQPYTGPIELGAEKQEPLNVDKAADYKDAGEVKAATPSPASDQQVPPATVAAQSPAISDNLPERDKPRPEEIIELRKRVSVLKSLLKCVSA